MTEARFENMMEHFGDVVEKTVEGAAAVIDHSMNHVWKFRPVRFIGKTLSFLAGAGLMASAIPLNEKGYHKIAMTCFISGIVVIVVQIAELLIFRKK